MEKKSKMIKRGFHKKENGSNLRKPLLAKLKTELFLSNKYTEWWVEMLGWVGT